MNISINISRIAQFQNINITAQKLDFPENEILEPPFTRPFKITTVKTF